LEPKKKRRFKGWRWIWLTFKPQKLVAAISIKKYSQMKDTRERMGLYTGAFIAKLITATLNQNLEAVCVEHLRRFDRPSACWLIRSAGSPFSFHDISGNRRRLWQLWSL
jgi:hypothetical protein